MALLLLVGLLGGCDDAAAPPASRAGYAGLGRDADAYARVMRGRPLVFPADHGPHDGYRIEWWYVTADLKDEDGHDWGVQWTLFRSALRPGAEQAGWDSPNAWMAHAALTDASAHQFAEKFARGGIGQAGVIVRAPADARHPSVSGAETVSSQASAMPPPSFNAWIDDWSLRGPDFDHLTMQASGKDFRYSLDLTADGPLVLHGDGGYSEKSGQGQASYYYSQPFYRVNGEVERAGKVHRVQGRAWLDREWSSQPLSADQRGWDWFSLHLASGAKVMLFQVRQANGEPYRAGTWIDADGRATVLRGDQVRLEALAWSRQDDGRQVPTRWRVRIAGVTGGEAAGDVNGEVDITVDALQPKAWMGTSFPY
ncbi:lipocalin-like domain-containing protein [Achromobacter aloeverae]|uniref:Iron ABC transporter permease n=1 Tax=Achromobacter aloeverae TaxID=1750518 RepID=A0A4Q1HR86_9BURK|nr:lipocalin-like domain-containing protein [Achromobacter aloeverae]RXN92926.1 iron ABC transporter permease [Achromobacter aloeverae]